MSSEDRDGDEQELLDAEALFTRGVMFCKVARDGEVARGQRGGVHETCRVFLDDVVVFLAVMPQRGPVVFNI